MAALPPSSGRTMAPSILALSITAWHITSLHSEKNFRTNIFFLDVLHVARLYVPQSSCL